MPKYHTKWNTKEARRVLDYILQSFADMEHPEYVPARYGHLHVACEYIPELSDFRIVFSYAYDNGPTIILDHQPNTLDLLRDLSLEIDDDRSIMSKR